MFRVMKEAERSGFEMAVQTVRCRRELNGQMGRVVRLTRASESRER